MPLDPGIGEVGATSWVLDEAGIAEDARCDGRHCIVTFERDVRSGEVIECYRGLCRIEESFRVVKDEMDVRPVYVSTKLHIHDHFPACFLVLLAMRLMRADVEWATGSRPSAGAVQEALSGAVGHRLFDYRAGLTDAPGEPAGIAVGYGHTLHGCVD